MIIFRSTRLARCLRRAPGLAALLAAQVHCSSSPVGNRDSLTVFAAASLTEAFTELGTRFEESWPTITVHLNFAGSQQLAFQIEQGARADVLATADWRWARYLGDRGLLADDIRTFTNNSLVAIVPASNPGSIVTLADIAIPGKKVVMPSAAVPAGLYTRLVLERLSSEHELGAGYASRVASNVVSDEDNVKAVLAKIRLGEADAGFVYRSDITGASRRFLHVIEIPERLNVVAAYPIGVLRGSANQEAAMAFIELVMGRHGRTVLARYGFAPIDPPMVDPGS